MAKLKDIAKVLRSKNSGPFLITLDLLFDNQHNYNMVKNSKAINKETISRLYNLPIENITGIYYYDAAMGIKISYFRSISSGTTGDRDVYGAQQHAPLLELDI